MTWVDRSLITLWILLISIGLVTLAQSRPKLVEHTRVVYHIRNADIWQADGGEFVMKVDRVYEVEKEKEQEASHD